MEDLKSSDRTIGSCKRTLPNNACIAHVDLQYASGMGVIDPGKVNSPLEPKSQLPLPSRNLNPNSKLSRTRRQDPLSRSRSLDTSTLPAHKNSSSDPERVSLIQNHRQNSNRRKKNTNENKLNSLFFSSSSSSSYSSTTSAPDDLKPWASTTIELKTPQSRATKSSVREYGDYATPVAAFVSKP